MSINEHPPDCVTEPSDDPVDRDACPTCGSAEAICLRALGSWTWYKCRDCGIGYTAHARRPTQASSQT